MDGISQKAAQKASFAEIPQPRYSGKTLYSTTKKVYYVKFTTHYAIHYSYLFISIHTKDFPIKSPVVGYVFCATFDYRRFFCGDLKLVAQN